MVGNDNKNMEMAILMRQYLNDNSYPRSINRRYWC